MVEGEKKVKCERNRGRPARPELKLRVIPSTARVVSKEDEEVVVSILARWIADAILKKVRGK